MAVVNPILSHLVNSFFRAECQSDHIDVGLSVHLLCAGIQDRLQHRNALKSKNILMIQWTQQSVSVQYQ